MFKNLKFNELNKQFEKLLTTDFKHNDIFELEKMNIIKENARNKFELSRIIALKNLDSPTWILCQWLPMTIGQRSV